MGNNKSKSEEVRRFSRRRVSRIERYHNFLQSSFPHFGGRLASCKHINLSVKSYNISKLSNFQKGGSIRVAFKTRTNFFAVQRLSGYIMVKDSKAIKTVQNFRKKLSPYNLFQQSLALYSLLLSLTD